MTRMSAQDHYGEAKAIPSNFDESNPAAALLLAEAQIHAVLFAGLSAAGSPRPEPSA